MIFLSFCPRVLINRQELYITSYNSTILIDQEMSKQSFRANEEKVLRCVGILWLWLQQFLYTTILFGYSQSFIFLLQGGKSKNNSALFSRNHIDTKLFGQTLSFITIFSNITVFYSIYHTHPQVHTSTQYGRYIVGKIVYKLWQEFRQVIL